MKDVKNAQYQRLALWESCLRMQTERGFLFKLIFTLSGGIRRHLSQRARLCVDLGALHL